MMNILQDDNFKALIKKINDGEDFLFDVSYKGKPYMSASLYVYGDVISPASGNRAYVGLDGVSINGGCGEEIVIHFSEDTEIRKEDGLTRTGPGSIDIDWDMFTIVSGNIEYGFSFV